VFESSSPDSPVEARSDVFGSPRAEVLVGLFFAMQSLGFKAHSSCAFFHERCVATERTLNLEPLLFRA